MESPKPKPKRTRIILIVVGGVLALCMICGAIGALTGGDKTPAATQETVAPMRQIEATSAPAPTTEAKASPTAKPTLAPTSTPQPTVVPTATTKPEPPLAVRSYAQEVLPRLNRLAQALSEIGTLMQDPQINKNAWTSQVFAQMNAIKLSHKEISAMEAIPAEMQDIHATLVSATTDLDQSMDHLATGIDNLNAAEIEAATTLMLSGNAKISKAHQMLKVYMAQFE